MRVVETHKLEQSNSGLDSFETYQTYNGLDNTITLEIWEELRRAYGSRTDWQGIYSFERALQAPYFDLMERGLRVDEGARWEATQLARDLKAQLERQLDVLATALWDKGLNSRSPKQLGEFFYGALRLPEEFISQKGVRRVSTGREPLEKLYDKYLYSRPFVNHVLAIRDLGKQLEVLETGVDYDGRFRASYNIAGTETGRPSSSKNAWGTGRNAQNIAPNLRFPFVSDSGYKMVVVDLEQVEARDVGFFCGCLFDDWTFLDSCESGDLHTNNAKRIWPDLPWTGNRGKDREVAERNFYRDFSFRDMAKRGSHLSNYMGTAWTAAKSLKVPIGIMEDFQARYCRGGEGIAPAFSCIPRWWRWTAEQLQTTRELTTPFGRRRQFFGRPNDDATLREAIAFLPQSTTADRMNLGMWRVWKHEPRAKLLAQTYDSITFQVLERCVDDVIGRVLELIRVELVSSQGRSYVVPGEAKVGWNWGGEVTIADRAKAIAAGRKPPRLNPEGLRKWKPGGDDRIRSVGRTLMGK